jgi:hypothetical protein
VCQVFLLNLCQITLLQRMGIVCDGFWIHHPSNLVLSKPGSSSTPCSDTSVNADDHRLLDKTHAYFFAPSEQDLRLMIDAARIAKDNAVFFGCSADVVLVSLSCSPRPDINVMVSLAPTG